MDVSKIQGLAVGVILSALVLAGVALAAQDRSNLAVPKGLSFAEFKGYEDWADVGASQTPESLKVIAANPIMIKAFKSGLPAAGKKFPEGSRVVKIEWSFKKNADSPYAVNEPDALKSVAFIVKDSKRFPKTNGWAYAKFDVDPKTHALTPEGTGAECGYMCHTTVAAKDYIFTPYPVR